MQNSLLSALLSPCPFAYLSNSGVRNIDGFIASLPGHPLSGGPDHSLGVISFVLLCISLWSLLNVHRSILVASPLVCPSSLVRTTDATVAHCALINIPTSYTSPPP